MAAAQKATNSLRGSMMFPGDLFKGILNKFFPQIVEFLVGASTMVRTSL